MQKPLSYAKPDRQTDDLGLRNSRRVVAGHVLGLRGQEPHAGQPRGQGCRLQIRVPRHLRRCIQLSTLAWTSRSGL